MITLPFADSVKTGLLASGWYANRLDHSSFQGVLTLCYHGIRDSADDNIPFANLHVIAGVFAEQIRMIADTCHPIDLQTLCDARQHGRPLPGTSRARHVRRRLPQRLRAGAPDPAEAQGSSDDVHLL